MAWAGTLISILGLTGLGLGALAFILWVGVSADLIVRHRFKGAREDEGDDLANGDMPHLAPDFLTSFHARNPTAEEQAGNV